LRQLRQRPPRLKSKGNSLGANAHRAPPTYVGTLRSSGQAKDPTTGAKIIAIA